MKTSSMLAATMATAALALAPSAAFGYTTPGNDNIIVDSPAQDSCTFPVDVDTDATEVTLTVRDANGDVAYTATVTVSDGTASFTVDLGANCDGAYELTATDQFGEVIAVSAVVVNADGGSNGGPTPGTGAGGGTTGGGTADNAGGLPSTGSSDAMLLSGLAGAGLLAGGSVLLVRRRRATV